MHTRTSIAIVVSLLFVSLTLLTVGMSKFFALPTPINLRSIYADYWPGEVQPPRGDCHDYYGYFGEGTYFICRVSTAPLCQSLYLSGTDTITHLSAYRCTFLLGDVLREFGTPVQIRRYRKTTMIRWEHAYVVVVARRPDLLRRVQALVVF